MLSGMETTSTPARRPYPSDGTDAEWAFVAPYLTLMTPEAPQRTHDLREVCNALRWIVRAGASWRLLPHDFPRWEAVYQPTEHWFQVGGGFPVMIDDLRLVPRLAARRDARPSAAIAASQTLQPTPESGSRTGYDGHKRKNASTLHLAVDPLGDLLAPHVTPANKSNRARVGVLAEAVQAATGEHVVLVSVDHGYTGDGPAEAAAARHRTAYGRTVPGQTQFSSGCRGAGWPSAPLPGRRVSGAWSTTPNGCRRRSMACIWSPSVV
jgi:transposase